MKRPIYVTRPSLPELNEYIDEIKGIWENRLLTNMGPKHRELESLLMEYSGASNVSLFANGHLALESALDALNLTGDVITSPFTFVSTAHAIVRKGLRPVFCDINPVDYTIDVTKIEELITERTSAILPIHVYGNICEVESIARIADKYGLKVIYDAAHAFGVIKDGINVGNFGDISMYSFHGTKVYNSIEGGALFYSDDNLKGRMESIANFGITERQSVDYVSGNAKMNEFQAAMGICNLRHIDREIENRKKVVYRYRENLAEFDGIVLSQDKEGVLSNYAYLPIIVNEDICGRNRNEIYEGLMKEQIYCKKYFYPIVSNLECYKNFNFGKTPTAEYISERVLCLPLYAELTFMQVDYICHIIKEILQGQ